MKTNDSWHRNMYDDRFAEKTIDAPHSHDLAAKEVSFLSRVLSLKSGAKILGIPCETGRHAVLFAKSGFTVTGIDINPDCLKRARRDQRKTTVDFRHGDMSYLRQLRGKFDAVVNLFSSFGYFSTDQRNKAVLQELISNLKPGGLIAIHLVNLVEENQGGRKTP